MRSIRRKSRGKIFRRKSRRKRFRRKSRRKRSRKRKQRGGKSCRRKMRFGRKGGGFRKRFKRMKGGSSQPNKPAEPQPEWVKILEEGEVKYANDFNQKGDTSYGQDEVLTKDELEDRIQGDGTADNWVKERTRRAAWPPRRAGTPRRRRRPHRRGASTGRGRCRR